MGKVTIELCKPGYLRGYEALEGTVKVHVKEHQNFKRLTVRLYGRAFAEATAAAPKSSEAKIAWKQVELVDETKSLIDAGKKDFETLDKGVHEFDFVNK